MVSEPFAPHPYVIVAAPAHALAGKARIEIECVVPDGKGGNAATLRARFVAKRRSTPPTGA